VGLNAVAGIAPAAEPGADAESKPKRDATDFTLVPVAGGDSDSGFGGGFIMSLARTSPTLEPYLWRVEAASMITFRPRDGELEMPFFDNYVLLDLHHVIPRRLGLKLRLSHTQEKDLRYFGLGNASSIEPGLDPTDPRYRYARTHPTFDVGLSYELGGDWQLAWGVAYTYNSLAIPADGLLAEDSASSDPDVRRLTQIVPKHGVTTFSFGIGWDTRDDEVQPERGQYHTVRLDMSPGGPRSVPYEWLRLDATARWYLSLIPERLSLGYRIVVDSLLGTPPFYELARYDKTYAIGGGKGVRGIPARRYHGMFKIFSNLEVRGRIVSFSLFDDPYTLGAVVFLDAGRVWADYGRLSELDGSGLGLHWGYGGGLRLAAGKSFVLRVDVASSPEAGGLSGYLTAGHLF
jgi:outer membrane protein assembly factor BamA